MQICKISPKQKIFTEGTLQFQKNFLNLKTSKNSYIQINTVFRHSKSSQIEQDSNRGPNDWQTMDVAYWTEEPSISVLLPVMEKSMTHYYYYNFELRLFIHNWLNDWVFNNHRMKLTQAKTQSKVQKHTFLTNPIILLKKVKSTPTKLSWRPTSTATESTPCQTKG